MEPLERFVRGDLDAFELLFQQYHRDVCAWLVRLVRDRDAAEDLTIEVFWRIYRARARFDPARSFGAWARRIAANAAIDHLRYTRTRAAPLPATPGPLPDSSAQRDLRLRVERALLTIPPRLRIVAELAFVDDLSQEEIADALDISRSAVKARAHRAMKRLKKALLKEGIDR
jgi:RNA polymerase sigma-70 factor (ECF subfamily)